MAFNNSVHDVPITPNTVVDVKLPFKVIAADRDRLTDDLLVYIEGQCEAVRVPSYIAPYQGPIKQSHIDYIGAVLYKRECGNIFYPRRHDAYKGFRQHTDQGAHP